MATVITRSVVEFEGKTYAPGETIDGLTQNQVDFLVQERAAFVRPQKLAVRPPVTRNLQAPAETKGDGKEE